MPEEAGMVLNGQHELFRGLIEPAFEEIG